MPLENLTDEKQPPLDCGKNQRHRFQLAGEVVMVECLSWPKTWCQRRLRERLSRRRDGVGDRRIGDRVERVALS